MLSVIKERSLQIKAGKPKRICVITRIQTKIIT